MGKVAIISDNHGYYDDELKPHLEDCDQIWHAGDIGSLESIARFSQWATFKAVYGNIDDKSVSLTYPLNEIFIYEGIKVFMTHIGGYPGKYSSRVSKIISEEKPNLYICGHSHICKVMPDKRYHLLHVNPGAYGHHGFHKIRTIILLDIKDGKMTNLRVVELGLRGHVR
ncbi:MAG: metallophosphoesterase family protein [Lewinellaceae bacterium]|nr:metallophosphoesterase family protein [Lewinellaceae bacterium]